MITIGCHKTTD
jgi:integrase/recombinase XerD